jgi:hypothetical protein
MPSAPDHGAWARSSRRPPSASPTCRTTWLVCSTAAWSRGGRDGQRPLRVLSLPATGARLAAEFSRRHPGSPAPTTRHVLDRGHRAPQRHQREGLFASLPMVGFLPRPLRWTRQQVVDGGAPDRASTPGWVGDHPTVGPPLLPPALAQFSVMAGADETHELDLGPTAQGPGPCDPCLGFHSQTAGDIG